MLQQRRTATVTSTKSSPQNYRAAGSRRRRKNRSTSNFVAICFVFSCAFAAVVFLVNRLRSGATATTYNNINSGRVLHNNDMIDPAVEERDKHREASYHSLYRPKFDHNQLGYDIYNCPFTPPENYPVAWKATEVLTNWVPHDVTTIAPSYREIYQGLCVFDYQTQYDIALNYRNAEMPFVIRNDPSVMSVAQRWGGDTEYLHNALGDEQRFRTERSPVNEFMWYRLRGREKTPIDFVKPPNDEIGMTYGVWLEHALAKDAAALQDTELLAKVDAMKKKRIRTVNNKKLADSLEDDDLSEDEGTEEEKRSNWYYFRLTTSLKEASKEEFSPEKFVYDELPFLDPRKRSASKFYIVDPEEERGINCRFGMRGIISENHFDMSRNFIMIFGGERRYVLGHPNQCNNMALYPMGHPSLRHSKVDWNNPLDWEENPEFKQALVNEVVLHAGDALYLPTAYFHYIVNLSLNYQCNARSGTTYENAHHIRDCGFGFK